MIVYTRLAWVVLLLGFAGCVSYQDRPLSASKTLDEFDARTLDREDLRTYLRETMKGGHEGATPTPVWDLPRLTLAAFFYSPQLDVVRSQWAAAKGQEKAAAERPNPSLGVSPGFNSTTGSSAGISPWIFGLAVDIPIETAGKRGYRMAEAKSLSAAARLRIAQAAWDVRRQVREALLDLYAADHAEVLLSAKQEAQEDNVRLLEHMVEFGEVSANELSQARIGLEETRVAVWDARGQQALAHARLADAVGVPAKALESVEFSFEAFAVLPQDVPPREARRQALLNREDLLAAMAEYQASQSALQREIANQYPDVQLGPGYEFDQSEDKWSVGLSVTLPVFNRNQGAIAAAQARREEAAATFRALQARIVGDTEQAVASYGAALAKVRATEALGTELRVRADRVHKMYEAGEIVPSEVVSADLEWNANAVTRLDARIVALRALGQMEDAMHVAEGLPEGSRQMLSERTRLTGDPKHEQ